MPCGRHHAKSDKVTKKCEYKGYGKKGHMTNECWNKKKDKKAKCKAATQMPPVDLLLVVKNMRS